MRSAGIIFCVRCLYFFFLFSRLIYEVLRSISTKLCHMLESWCNFRNYVLNFGVHAPWNLRTKTAFSAPNFWQLPDLTAHVFGTEQDIANQKTLLKTTDILQGEGMKIVYCGPQTRKTSSVIFAYQHNIFKPPLLKRPRSVAPENFTNGKGYQYLTDTLLTGTSLPHKCFWTWSTWGGGIFGLNEAVSSYYSSFISM